MTYHKVRPTDTHLVEAFDQIFWGIPLETFALEQPYGLPLPIPPLLISYRRAHIPGLVRALNQPVTPMSLSLFYLRAKDIRKYLEGIKETGSPQSRYPNRLKSFGHPDLTYRRLSSMFRSSFDKTTDFVALKLAVLAWATKNADAEIGSGTFLVTAANQTKYGIEEGEKVWYGQDEPFTTARITFKRIRELLYQPTRPSRGALVRTDYGRRMAGANVFYRAIADRLPKEVRDLMLYLSATYPDEPRLLGARRGGLAQKTMERERPQSDVHGFGEYADEMTQEALQLAVVLLIGSPPGVQAKGEDLMDLLVPVVMTDATFFRRICYRDNLKKPIPMQDRQALANLFARSIDPSKSVNIFEALGIDRVDAADKYFERLLENWKKYKRENPKR